MTIVLWIRGLLIGLAVAAVVGPICILCIQRTIHNGFLYGLVTGLGAATADAIYGSTAAFGLTVITTLLVRWQTWIHLCGGSFLIYLGVRTLLRRETGDGASYGQGKQPFSSNRSLTLAQTYQTPIFRS